MADPSNGSSPGDPEEGDGARAAYRDALRAARVRIESLETDLADAEAELVATEGGDIAEARRRREERRRRHQQTLEPHRPTGPVEVEVGGGGPTWLAPVASCLIWGIGLIAVSALVFYGIYLALSMVMPE